MRALDLSPASCRFLRSPVPFSASGPRDSNSFPEERARNQRRGAPARWLCAGGFRPSRGSSRYSMTCLRDEEPGVSLDSGISAPGPHLYPSPPTPTADPSGLPSPSASLLRGSGFTDRARGPLFLKGRPPAGRRVRNSIWRPPACLPHVAASPLFLASFPSHLGAGG